MIEDWKEIQGYNGLYLVSNIGNVKNSKTQRVLSQSENGVGYLTVSLYLNGKKKTHSVHKLLAMSFLNHIPCGYEFVVDHIDNNKKNNVLSNLQIVSNRENASKDRKNGTSNFVGVSYCNTNKKWVSRIRVNDKRIHLGYFEKEIEAHYAYKKELKNIQAGFNC